jgi:hypothetical protein
MSKKVSAVEWRAACSDRKKEGETRSLTNEVRNRNEVELGEAKSRFAGKTTVPSVKNLPCRQI